MLRSFLASAVVLALVPVTAFAHLERPAYWPDPTADRNVSPPAGGSVPKVRSLSSALTKDRRRLKVVCKPDSLTLALVGIRKARAEGYVIRPSQGRLALGARRASQLSKLNRRLFKRCRYRDIQAAVTASGNNGRVVIMPGLYTEQPSRARPKDDPACADEKNEDGSVTFAYHARCPNDANLIHVQGRAVAGEAPHPARPDRHGIPDAGRCLRCNLQIEGSGASPDDVRIEAAVDPATPLRQVPKEYAKDIALKLDRADGVVVRNLTAAHAAEHGIYVMETDGYRIERVRLFWHHGYGALMFTSDHGLVQDVDSSGSGDSSLYPGAAPDTGLTTIEDKPRINTIIRRNDLHHSAIGCSCAAMGNAILVEDNDAYDNGTGISTDSIGPSEHPGFPQDSSIYRNNRIHSNNFAIFSPDSDVPPAFFTVVGVGMAIWGGNANRVEGNHIYDNWRYGTMQLALPDAVIGDNALPDGKVPKAVNSTAMDNVYTRNLMGIAPDGSHKPNGLDFWWDTFPGATGNRWCNNRAFPGAELASDPESLPGCSGTSIATADPDNLAEYATCGALFLQGMTGDQNCVWWQPAQPPGSHNRDGGLVATAAAAERIGVFSRLFTDACRLLGVDTLACTPARERIGPRSLAQAGVRAATCGDWLAASAAERRQALAVLGDTMRTDLPAGAPQQTLADAEADTLFGNVCTRGNTQRLYLWGIYMQGAGLQRYRAYYDATR